MTKKDTVKFIREARWPRIVESSVRELTAELNTLPASGYNIPFPLILSQLSSSELFKESDRLSALLAQLDSTIGKLVASGDSSDLSLAAQLQTYKIGQESKLVQVQQQIIKTRK